MTITNHFFQNSIYNLAIKLYGLSIGIAAIFQPKAKKWIDGRKNYFENLGNTLKSNQQPIAWFHCASLGEYEQGRPVIDAFEAAFPKFQIVVSFFSPSGFENANLKADECKIYLPLDTPVNAKKLISILNPAIVFFVKYDFWKNIIHEIHHKNIPLICFSANFRKNQIYFKSIFFAEIVKSFNMIFVQNQKSKNLLETIDIKTVRVLTDTRFEQVLERKINQNLSSLFEDFKQQKNIIVAGSVHQKDMDVLIPFINQDSYYQFLIFPHEINYKQIQKWRNSISRETALIGEKTVDVVFIDKIGLLTDTYSLAKFAFVGGGFGAGLHSILEATVYGIPVLFGDKAFQKFEEAKKLIHLEIAFAIKNETELAEKLVKIEDSPDFFKKTSELCTAYFHSKSGASEAIIEYVKSQKLISD